jgi:dTDP-4-amino-4,6-dideoxygalactose transaminase
MTADSAEVVRKITDRTRYILAVHVHGFPTPSKTPAKVAAPGEG